MPEPAVGETKTHSSIHRLVGSPLCKTRPAGRPTDSSDTSKMPPWGYKVRLAAPVLLADWNSRNRKGR